MSYKVLYRKYRPQDFNSLYGQDNIKKLLIDSITNDKIAHAYLFSGPRGTGKTSTAKLFAKAINCEDSKNGIPCNKCGSCLNYEQSPDIIEIDAASNNGVDEIRNLRDNAKILPTYSKYKVYIIDEVHMLSQSAWNAFLKILEEPPKHVIFILATTEIQKIPITILSRCQRFTFQRISCDVITDNILRIAKEEKINIKKDAAQYISTLADGGMRDALSLLDQLSKENVEITIDLIKDTFGIITSNEVDIIFDSIRDNNIDKLNEIFDEYLRKGLDVNLLISKLLSKLFEYEINQLSGKSSFLSIDDIKSIAAELEECYNKPDALLLVKIILFSYIRNNKEHEEIISREIISDATEKEITKEEEPKQEKISKPNITEEIKKIRLNNSFATANKNAKEEFKKSWEDFINKENLKNNVDIMSLIEDVSIEVVSETNVLFSSKSLSTVLLFNESLSLLEKEFAKFEKMQKKFICLSKDEWLAEKKKYIDNKSKKYEYIEEPSIEKKTKDKIVSPAIDIFDEQIIEIK